MDTDALGGFLILGVLVGIFFLPTIIALVKQRKQTPVVIILNVLLGWTFFGWVAALVWAVAED